MLFSNEPIARFINDSFEPSWEMVRPVPQVRIDFGNGRVLHRTLHGNIATYACAADGQVCDILPGLYAPAMYRSRLEQLGALTRSTATDDRQQRQTRLQAHHRARVQALRAAQQQAQQAQQARQVQEMLRDMSKSRIERPLEAALAVQFAAQRRTPNGPSTPAGNTTDEQVLAEDTRRNETARRLQIHERLASAPAATPEQLKRWLYREVLNADLDDPYLGLGGIRFGDEGNRS